MIVIEYDSASLGVLAHYVDKIVYYEDASFPAGLKLLPSPHCVISINLTDRSSNSYRLNGRLLSSSTSPSKIVAVQTEPIVCSEIDHAAAVSIYLKPYAMRPICGIRPVSNVIIDFEDVFADGGKLRSALQHAESSERLEITKQFLDCRLKPLSDEALRRLEAVCAQFAAGKTDLAEVARKVNLSKRSIHDLVVRYIAVTPKALSHIYTLSRFIDCINDAERPIYWPAIVQTLGMYDQSHLIKVFKKMTSLTPTQWYSSIEFTDYPADEWVYPANSRKK